MSKETLISLSLYNWRRFWWQFFNLHNNGNHKTDIQNAETQKSCYILAKILNPWQSQPHPDEGSFSQRTDLHVSIYSTHKPFMLQNDVQGKLCIINVCPTLREILHHKTSNMNWMWSKYRCTSSQRMISKTDLHVSICSTHKPFMLQNDVQAKLCIINVCPTLRKILHHNTSHMNWIWSKYRYISSQQRISKM